MSFINPLFIMGGLVVAVPLLLHLMKREHARKIEFPTLMFLRRISKKTIRYQKLRHLLLLLLRILALLALVLAFMRPYREKLPAATAVEGISSAHIILLDNSMSMSFRDRWNQAKKGALNVLKRMSPADTCALLEFSDIVVARTQLSTDPSDAVAQIESGVELSDRTTRYGQALNAAEKLAMDAGMGKRIIYLISDFQKSGYTAEEQDFHLASGVELRTIDVGSDDFSNLAVRDIQVAEIEPGALGETRIKASIANLGNRDRGNVAIGLYVDDRKIAEKRIDTVQKQAQALEFRLPNLIAGTHRVMLEIEDPDLTRDNGFYLTMDARGKTPVLTVENPEAHGQRPPGFFLSKALNVDAFSPYRLTAVSLRNLVLSGGLVIWNDAPGGGDATQKKLHDFVAAGGGLAVVLGDSVRPADFNRSFGAWLPVQIADTVASGQVARNRRLEDYRLMTDIRMDHPIFQPFSKPHSGTFSSARFFSHARISAGPGVEIVSRFDNGDPALVSIDCEKGRVLIFASSADDSANDLPLKAVYAPFWQQMLRYLERFREQRHWVETGAIIDFRRLLAEMALRQMKSSPDPGEAIVILDPQRKRLTGIGHTDDVAVEKAGFYEIRTMNLSATVAVNTPVRESDLTHGNAEEMAAGWMSSKPAVFAQEERPTAEEQDQRRHFWMYLFIGAALLLIAESLLSNFRFAIDDLRLETNSFAIRQASIANRK
jgi:hypothetical protein